MPTRRKNSSHARTSHREASHAPSLSKKRTFAIAAAACLLVAMGIGACTLINGSHDGGMQQNDESFAQTAGAESTQAKTATSEPKKTEAGKQAIAHIRTAEERTRQSTSVNDVKPEAKTVYLTFDDGPSPNTQRILDILSEYGVKATWFVKGDQPQIGYVKDIWDADHQIAIHTYTHDYKQVYASTDAYWDDVHQAGSAIEEHLGFEPTLIRFPGGSHNSFNSAIVDDILARMASENYHYFDWNVSSGDGGDHDAQFLFDYTIDQAEECHSCCVLMHDTAAKDTTVEALPAIIEWFIDHDFEFDVLLADSYGYHF